MNDFYQNLIFERINKINELSQEILKNSFNYCKDNATGTAYLAHSVNSNAYAIKCITQELSGLLRIK